jgi:uncharacterized protein (TIGR02271 family)
VDRDTLDFERGTPVVGPDGEVGRLAHVVVDRTSGAASEIVVDRADGRWVVPIEAVMTADGDRVLLQDTWFTIGPVHFDPVAFDAANGSLVIHRSALGTATSCWPTMPAATQKAEPAQPEHLQLREEQLVLQKVPIESGAVLVGKEIVPEVRTIEVPIERERVVVEHRPIVGVSPAPGPVGERVIEVVIRAERVIVGKVPIVREEVAIGKQAVPEVAEVSATTRHERAVVDVEGDVRVRDKA